MMRVCVCTIVHHPEDARIFHRQIRALREAGHQVTYVAPFRACGVTPRPGVVARDVPRAVGRRRWPALRAARRVLAEQAAAHDLLLIHDPELLLALPRARPATVWDVHEDTAAALVAKPWLPRPLRWALRPAVRAAELAAERRVHLLLAEEGYRDRFRRAHPVVPNTTYVPASPAPPPGDDRVVYLGHLTRARGAVELVETARLLAGSGIRVEIIGGADPQVVPLLREAEQAGLLTWHGYVPNDRALAMLDGALAGLSLLRDAPNYRHSLPTKVVEYLAHGLPVVTTPTPVAARLVEDGDCGVVVPFGEPAAVAAATAGAVRRLAGASELRAAMGRRGYETARARYHWPDQAARFIAHLEGWARPTPARALGK